MRPLKISEPEIIDVLLGDADPALEARVRAAVRQDLRAAALYARWATLIPRLREQTEPVRQMNQRVRQKVMARLNEAIAEEPARPGSMAGTLWPAASAAFLGEPPVWASRPRRGRRAWAVAAAVAALLAVVTTAGLLLTRPPAELTVERAAGRIVAFSMAPGGQPASGPTSAKSINPWNRHVPAASATRPRPLATGGRLALPARLIVSPGASAVINLPGRGRVTLNDPVDLTIDSGHHVRQSTGMATYRLAHRLLARPFTVQIPQGIVEDLGTEFQVAVGEGDKAVVNVTQGRVRVQPGGVGAGREAHGGEQAVFSGGQTVVMAQPALTDLALERSRFKTHLTRRVPAPQAFTPQAPPPGVREVHYRSGQLNLKAWISAFPADAHNLPAVVYLHGGFSFDKADWDAVQPYLAAGYAVLAPCLRGENGNPGSFEAYYGEVDDAIAAGRYLAEQPGVDPERIYLAGHSIGATLAVLTAMMPSPYAAVAAIGPSVDPGRDYHQQWHSGIPFDPVEPREGQLRTARLFPGSLRRPLHLIFGDNDRGLLEEARTFTREAQGQGRACRIWVTRGDHLTSLAQGVAQSIKIFAEDNQPGSRQPRRTIDIQPAVAALSSGSALALLTRPQTITLTPEAPLALRRMPPFTSPQPFFGTLRLRVEGQPVEAAVACDRKVSGLWRIYLDANLNGDLTDDPAFQEGEDFTAGEFFEAGLQQRHNALWLRHPAPATPDAPPRLEFVNRLYLTTPVELGPGAANPAEGGSTDGAVRFNLIDTNSDGDTFDADGALGVWSVTPRTGAAEQIVALGPVGEPQIFAGYQWRLASRAEGGYTLSGQSLESLKKKSLAAGDPLPALEARTLDGQTLRLAAPPGGWLMLYVWSTWNSTRQRDLPFNFDDLYPKFKDRGLTMIGLSVDYREQDLRNFLAANPSPYPQVFNGPDLWHGLVSALGVDQIPYAILVDPQGKVFCAGRGGEELWTTLDQNLPPPPAAATGP